jgi:hypothetical protein
VTAPEEEDDSGETQATEYDELHLQQREGPFRLGRDLEQVVRAEPAQSHPDELHAQRRDVPGSDECAIDPPREAPRRKGEEHVQEEHRGKQVERDPDSEREREVRRREAREEPDEPRSDHQRAETAVGPAPPGDDPGEDVREQPPDLERDVDARLPEVVARQADQDGECGGHAAAERDRDEHGRSRRTRAVRLRSRHGCGDRGHLTPIRPPG